jgi:hypothetical protein
MIGMYFTTSKRIIIVLLGCRFPGALVTGDWFPNANFYL